MALGASAQDPIPNTDTGLRRMTAGSRGDGRMRRGKALGAPTCKDAFDRIRYATIDPLGFLQPAGQGNFRNDVFTLSF